MDLKGIIDKDINLLTTEEKLKIAELLEPYLQKRKTSKNASTPFTLANGKDITFINGMIMGEDNSGPFTLKNEIAYCTFDWMTGVTKYTSANWNRSQEDKFLIIEQLHPTQIDAVIISSLTGAKS